ncbi:hypothetical protein ACMBCN_03150, partial [Candidatus Liberibacter asiaticus]|nr:hypothetical protein [Candidatus Liberibacter asiaticus]MCZ8631743.1 hypothetical protein [Spiroplasma sp. Tabriz.8]
AFDLIIKKFKILIEVSKSTELIQHNLNSPNFRLIMTHLILFIYLFIYLLLYYYYYYYYYYF